MSEQPTNHARLPFGVAHRVQEGGMDVLYFKRIASPFVDDFDKAMRGEWDGSWEVMKQVGTGRVSLNGPNAHRTSVGVFATEDEADECMRSNGVQS